MRNTTSMKKSVALVVALSWSALTLFAQTGSPPQITCASDTTVECGESGSFSTFVSDADGDSLTVVWSLNGTALRTSSVDGTAASAGANVSFSAVLPLGTNTLTVTA